MHHLETSPKTRLRRSTTRVRNQHVQEPLSHVHDWLNRRCSRGFIDNWPVWRSVSLHRHLKLTALYIANTHLTYQTSCLCPATLLAGLKGSLLTVVEDMTAFCLWGARLCDGESGFSPGYGATERRIAAVPLRKRRRESMDDVTRHRRGNAACRYFYYFSFWCRDRKVDASFVVSLRVIKVPRPRQLRPNVDS